MSIDPLRRFERWFDRARTSGVALPEAMALATSGRDGKPSVRFVLLKGIDRRGLVFFTNARSRKGRELAANPRAAVAFYWDVLHRQVRLEGRIAMVSESEADAYWQTRPRASQLAARASNQSAPLASRAALVRRWRKLAMEHRGSAVPRPSDWTGFRLTPERIEFWTHREHRLHERELYVRTSRGWRGSLLQP